MAIPALVPIVYTNGDTSNQIAEATGVPVNGNNVVPLPWVGQGVDPALIDLNRITFRVEAQGPSVTGSEVVSLAPDKLSAILNFDQTGADEALVRATLAHTIGS